MITDRLIVALSLHTYILYCIYTHTVLYLPTVLHTNNTHYYWFASKFRAPFTMISFLFPKAHDIITRPYTENPSQ